MQPLTAEQQQLAANHHIAAKRLAHYFRHRYRLPKAIRDELQSEAFLALCNAARNFDPSRGVTFFTFAFPWIQGRIVNVVRRHACRARLNQKIYREYLWSQGVDVYTSRVPGTDERADIHRGDDATPDDMVMHADVRRLVERLPNTERKVIEMIYYRGDPLSVIGREVGFHRCSLSRYHWRTLDKLRRRWSEGAVGREKKLVNSR